jgi:hypothetical protein
MLFDTVLMQSVKHKQVFNSHQQLALRRQGGDSIWPDAITRAWSVDGQ